MAKTIKFPLKLKDDFPARTLEELKEHFDLGKMVGYFLDGKLLTWLQARYYETEADLVKDLSKDDADLKAKLCEIFDVELSDFQQAIDVEVAEKRNHRLSILRQYTSDTSILAKVDSVAVNQEDLGYLLDEGIHDIYLCNNTFTIPLQVENKKYIGIGKVIAIIRSGQPVDFKSLGIVFENVDFEYLKLPVKIAEKFYNSGVEAEKNFNFGVAIDFYKKSAKLGYADAMFALGRIYSPGGLYLFHANYFKAMKWYKKGFYIDKKKACQYIGDLYKEKSKRFQKTHYKEALVWYEKAFELGNEEVLESIMEIYYYGDDTVEKDYGKVLEWFNKAKDVHVKKEVAWMVYWTSVRDENSYEIRDVSRAIELCKDLYNRFGSDFALREIADLYRDGSGNVPKDLYKAIEYYKKVFDLGDSTGAYYIGNVYRDDLHDSYQAIEWYKKHGYTGYFKIGQIYELGINGVAINHSKAIDWYEKAVNAGDYYFAVPKMGEIYEKGELGVSADYSKAVEWYEKNMNNYWGDDNFFQIDYSKILI